MVWWLRLRGQAQGPSLVQELRFRMLYSARPTPPKVRALWVEFFYLLSQVCFIDGLYCLVWDLRFNWNIFSSVFLWTICYCPSWLCSFWLSPLVSDTPNSSVRVFALPYIGHSEPENLFLLLPFSPWLPELTGVYHRAGWVSVSSSRGCCCQVLLALSRVEAWSLSFLCSS